MTRRQCRCGEPATHGFLGFGATTARPVCLPCGRAIVADPRTCLPFRLAPLGAAS